MVKVILYFQSPAKTSAPGKLAGVLEIAKRIGWYVQTIDEFPTQTRLRELVEFWHPLGAIVECGKESATVDARQFDMLPTVFFSHDQQTLPSGSFSVTHDSAETARLAARELLMTRFDTFAYLPHAEPHHWCTVRQKAFIAALKLNGKRCRVFAPQAVGDATKRQHELRLFLRGLPKPCALFAANDQTAAEAITAARFEEIAIPEALAVLGVDNYEPICEHTVPTLSSIEPDFRRGGNLAALMLLARFRAKEGYQGKRHHSFGPFRIVRRASTRLLVQTDKSVLEALDFIRREACNGLTAARVARLFPCSRRQADIRFRKATGHSILDEIHAVQLDRAKQLLKDPNIQLKAISDFCGFTNPNSLRKFFKRTTGHSMRAWRAANRTAATGSPGRIGSPRQPRDR